MEARQPGRGRGADSQAQVRHEPETSQSKRPLCSTSSFQELRGHRSTTDARDDPLRVDLPAGPSSPTWARRKENTDFDLFISFVCRSQLLPEELSDWLVALRLLPPEGDDGRLPEREVRPRQRLQSAVEEVSPPQTDVDLLIWMRVLLPVEAQQSVQRDLHTGGTRES